MLQAVTEQIRPPYSSASKAELDKAEPDKVRFLRWEPFVLFTKCHRNISYRRNICPRIYTEMAAASYSSDVLQTFYGPIPRRENANLPELLNEEELLLDEFELNQTKFW